MGESKNSFIVYADDIKEILDGMTDEQVGALFRGMVSYQVDGADPDFSGVLKFAFIPIRQQMDRNNEKWERTKERRAESGRKGGIRSGEVRRARTENEANEASASSDEANEANEAVKVKVKVKGKVKVKEEVKVKGNVSDSFDAVSDASARSATLSSLCSYLNEKTGGNHQPTSDMQVRIAVLLSQGYTEADMKAVIDKKTEEWLDVPKMRQYLRPSTLFGKKFEQYLAEPESSGTQQKRKKGKKAAAIREDLDGARDELDSVLSLMERIRGRPGGIESEEYGELADQRMVLEQRVEQLSKQLERLEER